MHSNSPAGRMRHLFGRVAVPASLSPRQASERGLLTTVTSGPLSPGSSPSAALQSSLANRLQAALGLSGSTWYRLIWKEHVMPSGRRICAQRASARRISASDCTGWPTAMASDSHGSRRRRPSDLALRAAALISTWATPTTRDAKDRPGQNVPENGLLGRQALLFTDRTGAAAPLNPAHARWLMGYPAVWDCCGATAMQLSPSSRRCSSVVPPGQLSLLD